GRLPPAPAAGGGRGRQSGGGRGGGRVRPRGARHARARVASRGSSSFAARRSLAEPVGRLGVAGADPQRSCSRDLPEGGTYMNADRSAIAAPLVLDESEALTVAELLEGRAPTGMRRRGWVIRRALATADVAGLLLAFVLAEALIGAGVSAGRVLFFAATLPGWMVVAKLYGLYDNDEERTDHSTADEFVGVFHLVTIGAWILYTGAWLT